MALAPSLQIRRMLQTRSSRDVSLGYLALLGAGFVIWLAYGLSIGNWPLIMSNVASLTFMTITILVALSFRRRRVGAGSPSPSGAGRRDGGPPVVGEPPRDDVEPRA